MRSLAAIVALVCCNACTYMIPRSGILGQTAALPGSGTDMALSAGLAYAHEGNGSAGTSSSGANDQVMIPNLAGNLSVGLSDLLAFNLRGDSAGLQPGVTVAILRDDFKLAALPQVGIGYMHATSSSSSTGSSSSSNVDYVLFTAGARILASHTSGVFFGLGYAFEYVWAKSTSSGTTSSSDSNYQEHQLLLGLGYEVPVGAVKLRPEVSFILVPERASTSGSTTTKASGMSYVLSPTLTVAFQTGK